MSDRDVADLLDGLVAGLPDDVRDQLVARSDGIPVFAVETVRSLIDRDLVVPRGGQYVLADDARLDLDSLAAPASLQALIAARLDALSTEQRLVVDRGSVLGTSFAPDALADLCPEVADTAAVLGSLVRLQILSQDASRMSAGYGHYRFVQSAVRQVAYGVLSRRDRRAIHLAVLAQMVARGETGDDTAAIRAQHLLDALEAGSGPDDAELRRSALDELTRASAGRVGAGLADGGGAPPALRAAAGRRRHATGRRCCSGWPAPRPMPATGNRPAATPERPTTCSSSSTTDPPPGWRWPPGASPCSTVLGTARPR